MSCIDGVQLLTAICYSDTNTVNLVSRMTTLVDKCYTGQSSIRLRTEEQHLPITN